MFARKEKSQTAATVVKVELGLSGLGLDMQSFTNTKAGGRNKRRFSDDQVRSLEFMFESDSRPESQIKQQLANELGLQPRQIAIWFQNRRARSKSKQIERDYNILKESYNALASSYESLKGKNQSLRIQIKELRTQLGMEHDNKTQGPNKTENSGDDRSENRSAISELKDKVTFLIEGYDHTLSSNKSSKNDESRGEYRVLPDMMEAIDSPLTSSEKWCGFESNCFLDESSRNSSWWEFW